MYNMVENGMAQCDERERLKNVTTGNPSVMVEQKMSNQTVKHYHSAMDYILAANSHRHNSVNGMKKTMIARKNDSAEDSIININLQQATADDLLEGDIALDPKEVEDKQLIELHEANKHGEVEEVLSKRQASRKLKMLWHTRRVPYVISNSITPSVANVITRAVQKFNTKSCVHFVPRSGHEGDYVIFEKNDGCYSRIGRAYAQPGQQVISIGKFCDTESVVMHEMLHAVGFYHEQSRPDRDKFLTIRWNNIKKGYESQFLKYSHGEIDDFNIVYNYDSLMQYGRTAFSAGDGNTMEATGNSQIQLGGDDMTAQDVLALDTLYDCQSKSFNAWTQWTSFSPCDTRCVKTRQRYCYGSSSSACGNNANKYGIQDEYVKCPASECPAKINGNWGRWSPWGVCTRSCNEGIQVRNRVCDDPAPDNNGAPCPNANTDARICIRPRCTIDDYDDDFRNGDLGNMWQNDFQETPGLDWTVAKGSTGTEGTGPSSDHFRDVNGYYLYVESSNRKSGDNALLISKEIKPTKNRRCFKFLYHMFGQRIGSLSVIMYELSSEKAWLLFSKSGSQGDYWRRGNVTLASKTPFKLVIQAVIGSDYSDIAIDDLFVDDGSCDCQDRYVSCKTWAKNGDCVKSYDFMLSHCKKSCLTCGCKDTNEDCAKWAKENQCAINRQKMERLCPVTCRFCACFDASEGCRKWADNGECDKNEDYMHIYCKKSCKLCS